MAQTPTPIWPSLQNILDKMPEPEYEDWVKTLDHADPSMRKGAREYLGLPPEPRTPLFEPQAPDEPGT